jgi:hypothetical protein
MQNVLNDLEMKTEHAKIWNELERMQGTSMIENARRHMLRDDDSRYYRRLRC